MEQNNDGETVIDKLRKTIREIQEIPNCHSVLMEEEKQCRIQECRQIIDLCNDQLFENRKNHFRFLANNLLDWGKIDKNDC
jgi:hypothetical protein